ncbi:unnamed protein product [Adineta ricciae]|uniref:Uncharacterized protein n=1 Tax=Adineta ricciae TaxID=249248 RepID=A0A814FUH1_ADIRI|nr:unnamed protein product [Adineta ricciae]
MHLTTILICWHQNTNAKTIPNMWNGYYRITLAQFESVLEPEELKEQFESFRPSVSNVEIQEPLFTTRKISHATSHFRFGQDFSNEPIALFMSYPSNFTFDIILDEIKDQLDDSVEQWNWKEIKNHGIPDKVIKHPIEFRHATLQIIPSRQTCTSVFRTNLNNPWWEGVTILNGSCSNCGQIHEDNRWKGVCEKCEKYERIKPIWSMSFATKDDHSNSLDTFLLDFEKKLHT